MLGLLFLNPSLISLIFLFCQISLRGCCSTLPTGKFRPTVLQQGPTVPSACIPTCPHGSLQLYSDKTNLEESYFFLLRSS